MTSERSATLWLWVLAFGTVLALALMVTNCSACGGTAGDTSADAGEEITGACQRAFPYTLDAWNAGVAPVSASCRTLDSTYKIVLQDATSRDLAKLCNFGRELADNEKYNGCTKPAAQEVWLRDQHDDLATKDSAVHEWTHVLAFCVYDDMDLEHMRAKLWADYGPNTVESVGAANSPAGKCLP